MPPAAPQARFDEAGFRFMVVAIMISTAGCSNGLILSGARVCCATAQDHSFFECIGVPYPLDRTPAFALIIQAIWSNVFYLSPALAARFWTSLSSRLYFSIGLPPSGCQRYTSKAPRPNAP